MAKKLMVLGATYTQLPLVKAAQRLGYYTIVASTPGDYAAFPHADKICYVDITNPHAVLEAAKEQMIDGIATCCSDTGVRAVGYVCSKMGLCGLSENAALLSNQKLLMKEALVNGSVKTPAYQKVTTLEELYQAWRTLPQPVILKAVDLQASRGVYVCRTYQELEDAYQNVMRLTKENFCIIEQFVTGIDIGAQAFVYQGEILFILPHNDEVFANSANLPIGHSAPLLESEEIVEETKRQCEAAIRAVGLDNCAVNIDLIRADDGQIYIIELTGRAGATCLPELVSLYYGIDYYEMIAKLAMGDDPRPIFYARSKVHTANASRLLMPNKSGVLKKIENRNSQEDDIALLEFHVKAGDQIRKFSEGRDCFGRLVVTGADLTQCFHRLDEISANISIVYEETISD